jgi:hypothetical protein
MTIDKAFASIARKRSRAKPEQFAIFAAVVYDNRQDQIFA